MSIETMTVGEIIAIIASIGAVITAFTKVRGGINAPFEEIDKKLSSFTKDINTKIDANHEEVLTDLKEVKSEIEYIKSGTQEALRDRLYQMKRYLVDQGYATDEQKKQWYLLYTKYEMLGPNGVMDAFNDEIVKLPSKPSKKKTLNE